MRLPARPSHASMPAPVLLPLVLGFGLLGYCLAGVIAETAELDEDAQVAPDRPAPEAKPAAAPVGSVPHGRRAIRGLQTQPIPGRRRWFPPPGLA